MTDAKHASDARLDAIGKTLSTVIIAAITAMFLYAYLGHVLFR